MSDDEPIVNLKQFKVGKEREAWNGASAKLTAALWRDLVDLWIKCRDETSKLPSVNGLRLSSGPNGIFGTLLEDLIVLAGAAYGGDKERMMELMLLALPFTGQPGSRLHELLNRAIGLVLYDDEEYFIELEARERAGQGRD